jgi:hypothetical protein
LRFSVEPSVLLALGATRPWWSQVQFQTDATDAVLATVVSLPGRRGPGAALFRRRSPGAGTLRSRAGCHGPVPPHVPDGELDPADGAPVHTRAGRARGLQLLAPDKVVGTWAPVAGPVPAQRLERRESPAARLALEQAPTAPALPLQEEREDAARGLASLVLHRLPVHRSVVALALYADLADQC